MDGYQINESERITFSQDRDTRMNEITGEQYFVQVLGGPYGRSSWYEDTLPEMQEAVSRFEEAGLTGYQKARAMQLYAQALGYKGAAETVRGYSQGEWLDVFVYCKQADAERLPFYVAEFENFYRGEIYEATLETAKVFTAEDGEKVTIWQKAESLSGFVCDDQDKLHKFALEAFGKEG